MRALLCALVLYGVAEATVFDASLQSVGTLVTAQTATGVSANSVRVGRGRSRSLTVTVWNTGGTATVQLEVNCTGLATGWAPVVGSSTNLTVSAAALDIVYPACEYGLNVTTCSNCSVKTSYYVGMDI